jgi:hypothetical protein
LGAEFKGKMITLFQRSLDECTLLDFFVVSQYTYL